GGSVAAFTTHARKRSENKPRMNADERGSSINLVPYLDNSATISRTAWRASSTSSGLNETAPTTACPPPPYRSQSFAMLCVRGTGAHGFEPTEIFVRCAPRVSATE